MPRKSQTDSQDRQRTRIAKGIYRDAWGIALQGPVPTLSVAK